MDPNKRKQYEVALKLWEIEHKLLDTIQQLPNKGNYLIWRKTLLMKKANAGTLATEVC
jgi:hypothetical protein